jgi:hypothetical protein
MIRFCRSTKRPPLFIFIGLFILLSTQFYLNAQNVNISYKLILNGVADVFIPEEMEIQGGAYLNIKNTIIKNNIPCYEINPKKVIMQPKGINDGKVSPLYKYARIIFQPENLINTEFSENGSKKLDSLIHSSIDSACGFGNSRIITWNGTKTAIINGNNFFKTSYVRQMNKNPEVFVEFYYFIVNGKGYSITYSYRLENKDYWEPKFRESINSLNINK